jgi:mannose-1-phosphate guanylyltransferase
VKGFILAAGFGQRMRPMTQTLPKPCLPVGNLPLIAYAIKLLARHGIEQIAINTHHLGDKIQEMVGDGSSYGVQIQYSHEQDILGTGGALKKMESFLDETFVVVNSDIIIELDLNAVVEKHREHGAIATMVLRHDPRQDDLGLIEITDSGRIGKILSHGKCDEPLTPYMFTGVHVMEPRFLQYIPSGVQTCVNRYAYTKAINNDERLWSFVTDAYWRDLGSPQTYLAGNFEALDKKMGLSYADPLGGFALAPTKNVTEVIRMGENVELGENVRLIPPLIIGDHTKIGDQSVVGPHCVIGPKVTIAKNAHISNCVLMSGSKIEASKHAHGLISTRQHNLEVELNP